ncbi:DUF2711 family protein [Ferdinandcohnia sp. Marseille-Q9671]
MLTYIWINDRSPILDQLPDPFQSAAILFHPFIQMPSGWVKKREVTNQSIFPTDEEVLQFGKPIGWQQVMQDRKLTLEELAFALQAHIGALNRDLAREDLAKKLNSDGYKDLFYPGEDITSVFLLYQLMKILGSKGADRLVYHDYILDKRDCLEMNGLTPLEMNQLAYKEVIIADENRDFAFMNVYDAHFTLLLAKDNNILHIVETMKLEAKICDKETLINWYSR